MKTACVILNYNDVITTLQLAEAVEDFPSFDYLVLVDNCSTDNSFEILSKLRSDKIHVIRTERNGGYGYGNNRGIEYASSVLGAEFAVIANPDVEFTNECINLLFEELEKDSSCGAVAPVSLDPKGNLSRNVAWKQLSPLFEILGSSVVINRFIRHRSRYLDQYLFGNGRCKEVDVVPGSLLAINVDHFLKAGMYDEGVFLFCEEKILAWRFRSIGKITKLITSVSYVHRHSETINKNISGHIKKTGIWLTSKKYFVKKYLLTRMYLAFLADIFFFYARLESFLIGWLKTIIDHFQADNLKA